MNPLVDKSDEKFEWGKPNFELIKQYCHDIFDWSDEYINEILKTLEFIHS